MKLSSKIKLYLALPFFSMFMFMSCPKCEDTNDVDIMLADGATYYFYDTDIWFVNNDGFHQYLFGQAASKTEVEEDKIDSYTGQITGNTIVEIRQSNEWSNIAYINEHENSSTAIAVVFEDGPTIKECTEEKGRGERTTYKTVVASGYVDTNSVTSPPTLLHLLFEGFEQTQIGSAWTFKSITNDQNQDMTTDADWACLADNWFLFQKNGVMNMSLGTERCDYDDNIEGLYIKYNVLAENPSDQENPGEIKIVIDFEDLIAPDGSTINNMEFVVTNSNWNEISGTITHPDTGEIVNFVFERL